MTKPKQVEELKREARNMVHTSDEFGYVLDIKDVWIFIDRTHRVGREEAVKEIARKI